MKTGVRIRAGVLAVVLTATGLAFGMPGTGHAGTEPLGAAGKTASAVTSPGLAAAAVPAGFTTWQEVFAVQDRLNAAATRIVAARGAGYAGIVAAPQNRDLRVYWKGDVPPAVRKIAGGLGVAVRFLPARHTEREMLAEARRLAADSRVLSVGPEVDGSGLTLTVTDAGRQAIRSRTGVLGTATMAVHMQTEPAPQFLDRQDDSSAYWGGAKFKINGGSCTTGFAVFWNGEARMLTAGHCGSNGDIAWDGGDDLIGDVFNDNSVRDTMMINTRVEGETFDGTIFTGGINSNFGANVLGAAADFVGNLVCTGGARSGEHCGMQVTHVNQTDVGSFPLTRAELSSGCAAAKGDSGGPVYHYDMGTVIGRGTITSGRPNTASCPNAPPSASSRIVFWAPLLRPAGDATIGALQFYRGATIM